MERFYYNDWQKVSFDLALVAQIVACHPNSNRSKRLVYEVTFVSPRLAPLKIALSKEERADLLTKISRIKQIDENAEIQKLKEAVIGIEQHLWPLADAWTFQTREGAKECLK